MDVDRDYLLQGTATHDGVTVDVSVRFEPRAQYPDMSEFGEVVGAVAARVARDAVKARPEAPF